MVKCTGNVLEEITATFDAGCDRLSACEKVMDIPTTAQDASKSWNVRRYIGISPNTNRLCMANGMTCDDCIDDDGSANFSFPHGTILCFKDLDQLNSTNMSDRADSNIIVMAEGVRNVVGFDWHPDSNSFYFTDNGQDGGAWSYPDDELNYVQNGSEYNNDNSTHFGFPWCHTLGSGL